MVLCKGSGFRFLPVWYRGRHWRQPSRSISTDYLSTSCPLTRVQLWIDRTKVPLKIRARSSFWLLATLQGAWWVWATVLVTKFHASPRTYDWSSYGFGHAFAVYIFLTIGFQMNYLFLYVNEKPLQLVTSAQLMASEGISSLPTSPRPKTRSSDTRHCCGALNLPGKPSVMALHQCPSWAVLGLSTSILASGLSLYYRPGS